MFTKLVQDNVHRPAHQLITIVTTASHCSSDGSLQLSRQINSSIASVWFKRVFVSALLVHNLYSATTEAFKS